MYVDWTRIDSFIDEDNAEDLEWMKETILALKTDMIKKLTDINKFIQMRDQESLKSILHQLKGVAGNFGLDSLHRICIESESYIKTGNIEACIESAKNIESCWIQTKKELDTKFPD